MERGRAACFQVTAPFIFTDSLGPFGTQGLQVKAGIHPDYRTVQVVCACGNTFTTRSTAKNIHLEICAKCHPYFTGKQKLVDTAGRVERFRAKYRGPAQG